MKSNQILNTPFSVGDTIFIATSDIFTHVKNETEEMTENYQIRQKIVL